MTTPEKTGTFKTPYEKPALRTIDLAADEVLAAGCKIKGGTASNGHLSSQCVTLGSNCSANGT